MSDRDALRAGAVLTVSAGLVGMASYLGTLLMAHLLPFGDFVDYGAAQTLLTTVGVAASALVPLPLARAVRAHPAGTDGRRAAIGFAVLVAVVGGAGAAVVLTGFGLLLGTPGVAVAMAMAAFAVFAVSPVWGWLQGESLFGRYAVTSVAEVVLRLVVAIAAIALGLGTIGAVGAFVIGTLVVAWVGVSGLRRDLHCRSDLLRDGARWRETGVVAAVQVTLSALIGLDVLFVALSGDSSAEDAGYQAVAALAKGPVYVATSAALVSFPLLRNASAAQVPEIAGAMVRSFARLAVPIAVVIATVPDAVVAAVLPAGYTGAVALLPWLAAAGLGFGLISVLTMTLLGAGATRRCRTGLSAAVVVVAGTQTVGWSVAGGIGLAVGSAASALVASCLLAVLAWRFLPDELGRAVPRTLVVTALFIGLLVVLRSAVVPWFVAAVVAAVIVLWTRRRPDRVPGATLDVLHLGFEDPAMPGSGGGSLRTHEINRRLVAAGHRVTMLVTRFPGCRDGVRDGVRYVHVGLGKGRTLIRRVAGYALVLPFVSRRYAADLVVEDFFAPISSMGAPLWTGRRTVGVVQWLNARDKTRQYHLPFHVVERFGVRRHRRLVAVSQGVSDQLSALNPSVDVEIIGNGVDPLAFSAVPGDSGDVVYIGRLEIAQKGLDLLLHAWADACPRIEGTLVLAGTGPDEPKLRALANELGVTDRVRFAGWVAGEVKYDLLAAARVVVVPSRFETFGIVSVEALAAGSKVLAFDIPCLREVVPRHSGQLVEPFDVTAYADALVALQREPKTDDSIGRARRFARGYDWDALAQRQASFYLRAVHGDQVPDPAGTVRAQLAGFGRHRAHRRPPRLVVIGNVGNGNTGDESLLTAALAAVDADAEVTVLTRNPAVITALHGVAACPMTSASALWAVWRSDGVVVVGGGMFGPGLPPLVRVLPHVVAAVRRTGRDIAYVGIGVYEGIPAHVLAQLRRAAAHMTVRDRVSLKTLGPRATVPCVGDLAWLVAPTAPTEATDELRRAGVDTERPLLLLSPKAGADDAQTQQLVDTFSDAARLWSQRGGMVAALALSDRVDHGRNRDHGDVALTGAIALAAGVPIPVVGPNLPPAMAKAVVGQADAVLGHRFHALVFALGTGVPCAAFGWEPKTRALIEEHRLPAPDDLTRWLDPILAPHILQAVEPQ